MADQDNHARDQAAAQLEHIRSLVAALECDYDRLEELREERAKMQEEVDQAGGGNAAASSRLALWLSGDDGGELESLEAQAGEFASQEESIESIQEHPLSVQIRSGWYTPGATPEPEEFEILLCTGGPAVRILGQLNEHGEPHRAWLEYQDWGTPWTMYFTEGDDADDILLSYCQQFYFGQ